jgi:HK97 family phage prohead protease
VRSIHVREVRKETREVDYVASTETVDSYDEVLRQNWILDRYLRNPVILWAHNNDWAVPTLPIGRATKVRVEDKKLLITAKFSEANPFARIVFDMIVEGMLRAGSVGFRPHKVTRESIGGVERVVCDQNELYEFSICPIGSNPDALVDAEERMAKAIEAHAQRAMAGGAPAAPAPQQPARGERSGSVSVERAAEALRRLAAAGVITNSNPAPAGKRNKMKIKTLTKEQHDDLGRRGVISHECEGCKDILVLEAPGVVALAQEHRELSAKAQAADDRAKAAETARAEAETRAKSADDRAKAAETARDTAVAERDAATKRAGDEKARADKAISEKAAVELAPLTGIEPWQLSPAAAKRLAARAATDPDGYAADVAEVHDKGVKAGVLKSGNVPRVPETSKSDPTPAVSELDANAGDDRELLAEMEKRAKDYALLSAANATGVS